MAENEGNMQDRKGMRSTRIKIKEKGRKEKGKGGGRPRVLQTPRRGVIPVGSDGKSLTVCLIKVGIHVHAQIRQKNDFWRHFFTSESLKSKIQN
jgi:hypothetical protein